MINKKLFEHFIADKRIEKIKEISSEYNIPITFFCALSIILTTVSFFLSQDMIKWKILVILVAIIILILNYTIKNDLAKNVGNNHIFDITFLVISIICIIIAFYLVFSKII
jgi:hypothetical protein